MMYVGALILGIVSGLRSFTSPAVLVLLTRGGLAGVVVAILAVLEYVGDLLPNAPSRTGIGPLAFRILSGAVVGWLFVSLHGGAPIAGCAIGIAGALAGTYGGHAIRMRAIDAIGSVPAALTEDAVAIALAVLAVLKIF